MSKLTLSIKRSANFLLGFIPRRLPVGMTEFDAFVASLLDIYDLPTKDEKSVKFTIASIIMHLGANASHKSKYFFYKAMAAAAAKQVAGSVFYEIKVAQQKLEQEAKAALEVKNEQV